MSVVRVDSPMSRGGRRWGVWLSVLALLLVVGEGAGAALWWRGSQGALGATLLTVRGVAGLLALAWGLYGVLGLITGRRWRHAGLGVAATLAAYLVGSLGWQAGRPDAAIGAAGVWGMGAMFVAGLAVVRFMLAPTGPVIAVARTLIDEAIRMKIAVIFIVGLALLVPLMPFLMDAGERLTYRLQFFLTWSLGLGTLLLSLMTVFLACGSVSSDQMQKHFHMTFVKPISRGQYLLGKWLGIALLNLVLVMSMGVGVYTLARLLQRQPAMDAQDRFTASFSVLTARQAVRPVMPAGMDLEKMVDERIATLKEQEPEQYGGELTRQERMAVTNTVLAKWHAIGPRDAQTYVFTGLDPARAIDLPLQLRFKPKAAQAPPDKLLSLAFWFNDRPWPVSPGGLHVNAPKIVDDIYHTLDLDPRLINERGELAVRIQHIDLATPDATPRTTVTFAPGEGLELLYTVGGFEANLMRTLLVVWVRLAFLATLGLAASTFLGMPIASLLTFLFYFAAIASGFIFQSLHDYAGLAPAELSTFDALMWYPATLWQRITDGEIAKALRLIVRLVAQGFMLLVPNFSRFNAVTLASDGRVVGWSMVAGAGVWIGVIWSGVAGLAGYLMFRSRELARVTI